MGTLILNQIKRQASTFFQEKYRTARLVLTDVSPSEILTEDVTNDDPCIPDACTMTRIAEASYVFDDYWRIVDVLHRRLQIVDWKLWRQSYKTLVVLDFLLTHGPEDFAEEFEIDNAVIEVLATFKHVDNKGFDWGEKMKKKAERILKLISDDKALKEARLNALMVTKEIQGFGSSPSSSSQSSPSYADCLSPGGGQMKYAHGGIQDGVGALPATMTGNSTALHSWDRRLSRENGLLLNQEEDGYRNTGNENHGGDQCGEGNGGSYISEICSRIASMSPRKSGNGDRERMGFRSLSDAGKAKGEKRLHRQFSIGY
ncbi:hypothetical protein MLD38_016967 [Melastoma candidum]|uniref:Uncharacterized protein n=1 Tax=Melastoma candidum TaxID=119954 RepID=A0ACB9QQA9_9MYRT|nr:hypothetical protein MLD38_016967 [Melastoma candidum]